MKENKDIEQILLNDSAYEKLMKTKVEKEFISELKISEMHKNKEEITEITKVPEGKLFSKNAVYSVINKNSKTKSYINGVQAEGFLGGQNSVRQKLLSGSADFFVSGNCYVKFEKVKI